MDNITQKWIPILDEKNRVSGALIPYYIQYDHGTPKRILYVYEEEYQKTLGGLREYSKGIDNASYARKAHFYVKRNLENMFPDEDVNVIFMEPINIFNNVVGDAESDDIMNKRFRVAKTMDTQFETHDLSILKEYIETSLTYSINVTSEEIIRRFLNLPLYTHLIVYTREL